MFVDRESTRPTADTHRPASWVVTVVPEANKQTF